MWYILYTSAQGTQHQSEFYMDFWSAYKDAKRLVGSRCFEVELVTT